MNIKRLNTKTYARNFRKHQDYLIPKVYKTVKSNLNAQLKYANDLLLETKSIGNTLARLDRRKLTDMNTEMLRKVHSDVGLSTRKYVLNYISYEKKSVDTDFLNAYFENLIYQLSERGQNIADTSIGNLTAVLHEAAAQGLSISATSKLLKKEFNRLSTSRATLIARTECISAGNRSSLLTIKSLGEEFDIKFYKIWTTGYGARTRPTHSAAGGQKVEMDQSFIVGGFQLQYPGDINGPAKETIQCRCCCIYEEG